MSHSPVITNTKTIKISRGMGKVLMSERNNQRAMQQEDSCKVNNWIEN